MIKLTTLNKNEEKLFSVFNLENIFGIFHLYLFILESQFLRDTEWLMKSFEEGFRQQSVLIAAPDVLQPNVLHKVISIHNTNTP